MYIHDQLFGGWQKKNVKAELDQIVKGKRFQELWQHQPFQDMLIILTEMYPQMYYRELAFHLERTCGWAFTTEQVRQVLRRHKYKYNEIHEFRPREQDPSFFAFYRNHVIYPGVPFSSNNMLVLDEDSTRREDMWRRRAHGPRGTRRMIPIVFANAKNAASSVIAVNIQGCVSCVPVDVPTDGNISTFLSHYLIILSTTLMTWYLCLHLFLYFPCSFWLFLYRFCDIYVYFCQ